MQGGILSIDAAPGSESLVATAGADGVVVLFDHSAGRIKASLTGHSKKVNGEGFPCETHHQVSLQRALHAARSRQLSQKWQQRCYGLKESLEQGALSQAPAFEGSEFRVAPALLGDGCRDCMRLVNLLMAADHGAALLQA